MPVFKLKSPGFLNNKIRTLQIFKNSGWQVWLPFWLIYKVVSNVLPYDASYIHDFNLYKMQKHTKNLGKTVCKILAWSLSPVWYGKTQFSRVSFSDFTLKLLQISWKKLLGIHLRTAALVENFSWMFPKVLVFSIRLINSPYEVKYRWNEYHNNLKYYRYFKLLSYSFHLYFTLYWVLATD